jgi:hypothetical protein
MVKLSLSFVSKKEEDYYKVNNPEKLIEEYEDYETGDTYYPFFKSKTDGDMLLKVKSKYINSLDVIKDEPFNARITFKDFKMIGRDKKTINGLYVNSVKFL